MKANNFNNFLKTIQTSPDLLQDIPYWNRESERQPIYQPFPEWLSADLIKALADIEINELYLHQRQAIDRIQEHENIVLSTGTASGKSICYQLPILNNILMGLDSRALLIFPTKALANDQLTTISEIKSVIECFAPERSRVFMMVIHLPPIAAQFEKGQIFF